MMGRTFKRPSVYMVDCIFWPMKVAGRYHIAGGLACCLRYARVEVLPVSAAGRK